MWRLASLALVAAGASFGAAGTAVAERGNPRSGDTMGEAPVAVASVAVERASLLLDLRPLAHEGIAAVTATYRLDNQGAARTLEVLVPSAPDADGGAEVTADGRVVRPAPGGAVRRARAWPLPTTVPTPFGGKTVPYRTLPTRWLRFVVPLSSGPHDLEVRYRARMSAYAGEEPTLVWQLAYVLAPARGWDGFGGLDVLVQLPSGWRAASAPALERAGDVLARSFRELPADALAIGVQAPSPSGPPYVPLAALGGLSIVVTAGALGGRVLRSYRRPVSWSLLFAVPLGLAWALVLAAALLLADPRRLVPAAQVSWNASGAGSLFGLTPLTAGSIALIGGVAIAQLAAFAGYRRSGGTARRSSRLRGSQR